MLPQQWAESVQVLEPQQRAQGRRRVGRPSESVNGLEMLGARRRVRAHDQEEVESVTYPSPSPSCGSESAHIGRPHWRCRSRRLFGDPSTTAAKDTLSIS